MIPIPLNDEAYLIPGNAFVYTAAAGTAAPLAADLDAPLAAWTLVGHLGLDDGTGMPSFEFEGGETTVKGSMSKKNIRSSVSKITRSVAFSLSQFDRTGLGLYYGGTGGATTDLFGVKAASDGVPTNHALLFTFRDGDVWVGFWAGVVDTLGADSLATEDVENAVLLPLRSTILDPADPVTTDRFTWISSDILAIP